VSEEDFQKIEEIMSNLGKKIETITSRTERERDRASRTIQRHLGGSGIQRFSKSPMLQSQEGVQGEILTETNSESFNNKVGRFPKASGKISSLRAPLMSAPDVGESSKAQHRTTDVKVDHACGEPTSFIDATTAQQRTPFFENRPAVHMSQWANVIVARFGALFSEMTIFGAAFPIWGTPINRARLWESALLVVRGIRGKLDAVQFPKVGWFSHSEGGMSVQMVIGAIFITYVCARLWLCWMDEMVPEGFMYVDYLRRQ
jgi:hypothetical protein